MPEKEDSPAPSAGPMWEFRAGIDEIPDWFRAHVEHHSDSIILRRATVPGDIALEVKSGLGTKNVVFGDFVVRNQDGEIAYLTPEEYGEAYRKPAPSPSKE